MVVTFSYRRLDTGPETLLASDADLSRVARVVGIDLDEASLNA